LIYGIGIDLIEIARIDRSWQQFGLRFADRVLGPSERQRFEERRARSHARGLAFLATRFAAKEAISKALGLGMRQPMTWRAAEVLNAPGGKPIVVTHGALADFVAAQRLRLSISVTDERSMAAAYAIAEVIDKDA
jgi:holo-[acyl-carrier protein] synthase